MDGVFNLTADRQFLCDDVALHLCTFSNRDGRGAYLALDVAKNRQARVAGPTFASLWPKGPRRIPSAPPARKRLRADADAARDEMNDQMARAAEEVADRAERDRIGADRADEAACSAEESFRQT